MAFRTTARTRAAGSKRLVREDRGSLDQQLEAGRGKRGTCNLDADLI